MYIWPWQNLRNETLSFQIYGRVKIHSFKLFISTIFLPESLIGAHSTTGQARQCPPPLTFSQTVVHNSPWKAFYSLTFRPQRRSRPDKTHVGSFKCTLKSGRKICHQPKVAITLQSHLNIPLSAALSPCKIDTEHKTCRTHTDCYNKCIQQPINPFLLQLLSKMAPLIGREMSQRLFLQRFATLCVDPLFHVRKVCAANFGDFSGVVGSDPTEQTLVSASDTEPGKKISTFANWIRKLLGN